MNISIFIHYIYVTFYACSFSYNNIHIYIYIYHVYFQSEYLNVQVFVWLSSFIFLHIVFMWKFNCYCLTLNCYCPTVTIWTLLRFLTISRWKAKTRGYKFSEEGEPNSASKIVKIAHQLISPTALQNQSRLDIGWWPITGVLQLQIEQDHFPWLANIQKLQFLWRNPILIPSSTYPKSHQNSGDKCVQIRHPLPFTPYFYKLHTTHEVT